MGTLAKEGCNITVSAKSTEEQPNLPGTIFSVAREVEALGVEALPFKCNGVNARGTFLCAKACLPHMLKQKHGHIINMSPPVNMEMLDGKIAYCLSKFGMTLVAHGIGIEYKGTGVACNALWPATMIESYATINFQMGTPAMWRKGEIIADALLSIVQEDPKSFSGYALIDEDYLRSKGVKDFAKYRCDPDTEPPRIGA